MNSSPRRVFLKGFGALAVTSAFSFSMPLRLHAAEMLHYGGKWFFTPGNIGHQEVVCRIDLEKRTVQAVPIDFMGHSFSLLPGQASRAVILEKWGTHAVEVDFDEGRVTREMPSEPGTQYHGHSLFTPSGEVLFVAHVNYKTGQGHLVGLDPAKGYKKLADYQVTVGGLHECRLTSEKTALVSSTGIPRVGEGRGTPLKRVEMGALVHVDLSNGKVLSKHFIPDADQALAHFALGPGGTLVAASAPRPEDNAEHGNLYVGNLKSPTLKRVPIKAGANPLHGEMLSVAIDDKGKMGAGALPDSSTLFLVDIATATVTSQETIQNVNGVAYDAKKKMFVSSGGDGAAFVLSKGGIDKIELTNADGAIQNISYHHHTLII